MECTCIAITGASGFVGGRLVRALVRHGPPPYVTDDRRLTIVRGDMVDPSVLTQLLRPGCTVANFAYDGASSADSNLAAGRALADASANCGVTRIVHCSTAVVVGNTPATRIDETTACNPTTDYEKTKLAIENLLRDKARGKFEFTALRPTAVFGPGGRNLLKMAHDLITNSRVTNYLRSCLNDDRRLHLVDVDNVVAAVEFLLTTQRPLDGETFIVADDDAPENNYRAVEQFLMHALAISDYRTPRVVAPASFLSLLLRLRGRSLRARDTVFVADKLSSLGFIKPVAFAAGIARFADWYKYTHAIEAGPA